MGEIIRVTVAVPAENVYHVIAGANVGYWAREARYLWAERLHVVERDGETFEFTVSGARMAGALSTMAEKHPKAFAEIITGFADADVGDLLIQLACFGEQKYG